MTPDSPSEPHWLPAWAKSREIQHLALSLGDLLQRYHECRDDLAARRIRRLITEKRAELARAQAELGRQLDAPATWRRSEAVGGSLHR